MIKIENYEILMNKSKYKMIKIVNTRDKITINPNVKCNFNWIL